MHVLPDDAFHSRRDVANDRRVDEAVKDEDTQEDFGDWAADSRCVSLFEQPPGRDDCERGYGEIDEQCQPDGKIPASRRRLEERAPLNIAMPLAGNKHSAEDVP